MSKTFKFVVNEEESLNPNFISYQPHKPQIDKNIPESNLLSDIRCDVPDKKQLVDKIMEIDEILLFLFDNPILRFVYYPFFEYISQYCGLNGRIYFYCNYIDKQIFEDELVSFGKFSMERIDDFKKCVLRIIDESERRLPTKHSKDFEFTSIRAVMRNVHLKRTIETNKSLIKEEKFTKLMYWISEKMFRGFFIQTVIDCCEKISSRVKISFRLMDQLEYIEYMSHSELRSVIAEYIAVILQLKMNKNKTKTKYEINSLEKRKCLLEDGIPKLIKIESDVRQTGSSRISFFKHHFK